MTNPVTGAPPPSDRAREAGPVPPQRTATVEAATVYRAVLLAAGLVIGGLLLEQLATLAIGVLVTVILAIPASAVATRLELLGIPRQIGALAGLLAIVALFVGVLALVIPPIVDQANAFTDDLPRLADDAVERVASVVGAKPARVGDEAQAFLERYADEPQRLIGPITSLGTSVLTLLAGIVFVLITAYYMAMSPQPLVRGGLRLFRPERREQAAHVMDRLRAAWVGWLQGVAIDMLVSGVLLYIGLRLAGVEFALLFAAFSAILVVVPYFGAFLGGIPPVLFALADSPGKALIVFGIYLLVQQVEGNLIVPLVMARRVKLHPAVIAIGVLSVGKLLGAAGLLVSVPIISTVVILTEELWVKPRERRHAALLELPPSGRAGLETSPDG
ncbi:MAG: AI-2E family transporter [Thermoleophilaceae bacterium]